MTSPQQLLNFDGKVSHDSSCSLPTPQLEVHVAPLGLVKRTPPKHSPVFETYWRFAAERQAIFHRRLAGAPAPWTEDKILQRYKFTNAYRASDRVSQYLIQHVIYNSTHSYEDTIFRILLFKVFNRIDTWMRLAPAVQPLCYKTGDLIELESILSAALSNGERIYSAAYIMPSGTSIYGYKNKHKTHIRLLRDAMRNGLTDKLVSSKSMSVAFKHLRAIPTIGDFLAYQYVTDINYAEVVNFSEMDFVVPGPGARDGIRKCFTDLGEYSEADIIKMMAEKQEDYFRRYELNFLSLWGRPLQLIDCQNIFCEVDKYARVYHPEITGLSGRIRIKQTFKPKHSVPKVWYPPKWNLNQRIGQEPDLRDPLRWQLSLC